MKRVLLYAGVPVLLAAIAILTVVPVAQSAILSTPFYNIHYFNRFDYYNATKLRPYLGKAFWAARTTIGYATRPGKINIYFKYSLSSAESWSYVSTQSIFLNTRRFYSWHVTGSETAFETARILFSNHTRAHLWNWRLLSYRTFLRDALAWYARTYVYNILRYTRASAFYAIKREVKWYARHTGLTMSWYDAGTFYSRGSGGGAVYSQAIWNLSAIGWYLTGGRLTTSSPLLKVTLEAMRRVSSSSGVYLRSSNYGTALRWFENCFNFGYRRYSNAGWNLTGSTNQAYKDTRYLYGIFWFAFYL